MGVQASAVLAAKRLMHIHKFSWRKTTNKNLCSNVAPPEHGRRPKLTKAHEYLQPISYSAKLLGRLRMSRNVKYNKIDDNETCLDHTSPSAIRYLDPDVEPRNSDVAVGVVWIIVLLLIFVFI
jgi:hypothetical protein